MSRENHRLSESDIQTLIIAWLRTIGIFCWRNQSAGVFDVTNMKFRARTGVGDIKGTSDILGLLDDGTMLAIEVKTEKGRVSREQNEFINNVVSRGGVAFVARSLQDAQEKFARFVDGSGDIASQH